MHQIVAMLIVYRNMDDFIRRQYTYRRMEPNPLLKVERIWRELSKDDDNAKSKREMEASESDLEEVEEVEQQSFVKWLELSVPERLGVLNCLCEWHLHSEKFRERAEASTSGSSTDWRIDPIGTDSASRLYYFLDDNRLYRCSDPAAPDSILAAEFAAKRKRRKKQVEPAMQRTTLANYEDDWKCIASTYREWEDLVNDLPKAESTSERRLYSYLRNQALPIVADEEAQRQARAAAAASKAARIEAERVRELLRMEAMSTRKRSSRLQGLEERKKEERAKIEEQNRIRELEDRAKAHAELADYEVKTSSRRTREGRARDRELQEYLASGQRSLAGSRRSSTSGRSLTNSLETKAHPIERIFEGPQGTASSRVENEVQGKSGYIFEGSRSNSRSESPPNISAYVHSSVAVDRETTDKLESTPTLALKPEATHTNQDPTSSLEDHVAGTSLAQCKPQIHERSNQGESSPAIAMDVDDDRSQRNTDTRTLSSE